MPKSLPSARQLVVETWQLFLKTWNESIKVSMWFLYVGLVYFAVFLLLHLVPSLTAVGGIIELALLFLWSWTVIRLVQACFRLTEGKDVDVSVKALKQSWTLLLPLLWVGLLQLFVLFGVSVPLALWSAFAPAWIPLPRGVYDIISVALMLPILYIGIRLSFVPLVALDRGSRGLHALAQSNELVHTRWWSVFYRQIVACVAFGALVWIIASSVFFVLGFIVGPEKFSMLANIATADPLMRGIIALLEGMLQAVFMPLFVLFFVKLYKSLKNA